MNFLFTTKFKLYSNLKLINITLTKQLSKMLKSEWLTPHHKTENKKQSLRGS